MTDFQQYRRKEIAELRPWVPGEELKGVSISEIDGDNGSPKPGDMIARNPKKHEDQWLVAARYFADNFEPAADEREEQFSAGDVVQLRSGGRSMTVTAMDEPVPGQVNAVWMVESGAISWGVFPLDALKLPDGAPPEIIGAATTEVMAAVAEQIRGMMASEEELITSLVNPILSANLRVESVQLIIRHLRGMGFEIIKMG